MRKPTAMQYRSLTQNFFYFLFKAKLCQSSAAQETIACFVRRHKSIYLRPGSITPSFDIDV